MFANLKNKIFEEVKASPQKLQQFAQAAQAAVSSASSNTSESASGTDNFFSITEEDTPQNTPQKRLTNKSSNEGVPAIISNTPFNTSTNGPTGSRTRRLSNSSVASDVSFRLPTYDSPAVYHLQSDLDISASEVEDSVGAVFSKLEHISKEHLYDAYKKALTRYQKYRSRYTELANRYKELERDNGKARQVLVETQDKAIRRISELKEQCSLEQQAKSHLEEALRMEMDDMQCKIKAYQTKLKLLGENSEVSDIQNLIHLKADEPNLISLDAENNDTLNRGNSSQDLQNRIQELEKKLFDRSNSIDDMNRKINEYEMVIENFKKREEENSILLAQNKLMVHSELENKESEVKVLKSNLVDLENKLQQSQKSQSILKSKTLEIDELQENLKMITISKQEFEARVVSSEHIISELKQDLKQKDMQLQNEKTVAEEKRNMLLAEFDSKLNDLMIQNEELNEMLKQSSKSEIELAEIDNELNRIKIENVALHANAAKARDENEMLVVQNKTIKTQLNNNEMLLRESQEREATLIMREFASKEELESLRNKVAELTAIVKEHEHRSTVVSKETSTQYLLMGKSDYNTSELELDSNILGTGRESKYSISQCCLDILQRNLVTIANFVEAEAKLNDEEERAPLEILKLRLLSILAETQNRLFLTDQLNYKQIAEYNERTSRWEVLLEEAEGKLKEVENENVQLIEKNRLIEETYNSLTTKQKDNEIHFRKKVDALSGIIKETEEKYNNICNEKAEIHKTIKQLNEKLSQVLDEKSQLHNAKEIFEKEVRSLKHQLEEKEKECICAINFRQCLEAEIISLKEEMTSLRRESSNLIEISNNMRGDFEMLKSELIEEKALRNKINTEYGNVVTIKTSIEKQLEDLQIKLQLLENEHEKLSRAKAHEVDELEKRNKYLEEQCIALQKELNSLQQSLQEKETFQNISETLHENRAIGHQSMPLSKEADSIKHKIESDLSKQDENQDRESINESIRNATDLEKKLKNYGLNNMENECLKSLLSEFNVELRKCREENLQYTQDIEVMKHKREELQKEINILNEQKEKQKYEIEFLSEELEKAKSTMASLSESLKLERATTEKVTEQNINATSCNEFTKNELLLVQEKLAEAEKLCGETRRSYESISNENQHLKNEVSLLSEQALVLTNEIESNKSIISNTSEELRKTTTRLEEFANIEEESRQLQCRIKDLELVQLSKAEKRSEDISDYDGIRKLNEALKEELEDLKTKTSAQISELNNQIENMSTNSKFLAEKLLNYENFEEECTRLTDDLNELRKTTAPNISSSDVDAIRQEKKDLENKLNKIMHEVQDVSNRNLFLEQKCENYLILEQSNVRLKLANEKLSRQLDETLVSMHHNEGIQANTEFEYLRNIMFQYLTGTVNGNSGTLVKVIAAVLKFSPQQTLIVLQKEQQRHSLLGQINHLL